MLPLLQQTFTKLRLAFKTNFIKVLIFLNIK